MKVQRGELSDALDKLRPGLSPKELIQQMTHYNFMGDYIVTYNDLVSVYYPFKTKFVCSVKAESLYNVLTKLTEDEVDIDLRDKEVLDDKGEPVARTTTLVVKTATAEAEFPIQLGGDLTDALVNLEKEMQGDWEALPTDFVEGAYLCMFSASKDAGKGTLTCLNVNGTDLIAFDGNRVMWYTVETEMQPFMIKAGCAKELRDLKVTSYKITDAWVHFRNDAGVVVNIRRIKGKYKEKIKEIFETVKGEDFLMPSELKEAIDLCGVVHTDVAILDKQVLLTIENQMATCSASREGGFFIKKSVPISFYTGGDLAFYINSEFLNEVIERTPPGEDGERRPPMILDIPHNKAYFKNPKFKHVFTLKTQQKAEA